MCPLAFTSQVLSRQSKYHLKATSSYSLQLPCQTSTLISLAISMSRVTKMYALFHFSHLKKLNKIRCNQVTTIWLKLCKKEMVEGYNGKIVKFNFIHTGEGCKHSLSNMVPKLNKYICCSAQFFFFLSDNEISWGSHVPNYVQFQTAQHSYSETAVKSNVGVTQIHFFPLPAAHWVTQLPRSSTFYTTKGSRH